MHRLRDNVTAATACLRSTASELATAEHTTTLAEGLASCAGTTIMDEDDDAVLSADPLSFENGTLVVSSEITDDQILLTLYTHGSGLAEVGVTRARALLATCWQVTIDLSSDSLDDFAGTTCKESVVASIGPAKEIPFDDLDLPGTPTTD